MKSNAAMRLTFPEPEATAGAGIWEIHPRTGEHVLSRRARELLGIGDGEEVSIQRLLAALDPGDRESWKEAVCAAFNPDNGGGCSIEFHTGGPVPRCLAATGRTFFEGMVPVLVAGTLRDVTGQPRSLGAICRQAIAETLAEVPGRSIHFECWDEAPGEWDRGRLLQLLRDLIDDAIDRGAPGEPVIVATIDCNTDVLIAVASFGGRHFGDLPHFTACDEIVRAQGGRIEVISDDSATVFHVWLPKKDGRS